MTDIPENQTKPIEISVCKQMSSNSFTNEISYKVLTCKSCINIHLNMSKQMTNVKLLYETI